MPGDTPSHESGPVASSAPSAELRAREACITGKPPRIEPLKPGEYGKEASEMLAALRKAISSPRSDEVPEFIATMLRHSALFRSQVDLSLQLYAGALPARDSESRGSAHSVALPGPVYVGTARRNREARGRFDESGYGTCDARLCCGRLG